MVKQCDDSEAIRIISTRVCAHPSWMVMINAQKTRWTGGKQQYPLIYKEWSQIDSSCSGVPIEKLNSSFKSELADL